MIPPSTTSRIRAVDADYVSLTIRVLREFMADLDQVAAALSHIIPNHKPADVLWECMRRTLAERARRKGALPARTTPAPGVTAGRASSDSATSVTPAPGVTAGSASSVSPASLGAVPEERPSSGCEPIRTPAPGEHGRSDSDATFTPAPGVTDESGLSSVDSRYVPLSIASAVWARDEGCCAFVSADGRRCRSTHQLELHHRTARALGGPTSAGNLSLYCRRHNALAAERDFGVEFMASFRRSN